eukprot:TRINITY_DN11139_c0_g1_i1.p1 TRINITY_DN11139_c0_g1~~TRINITY_DN11139_c0_g1_i1.p1  ORF type:complete len:559 (+),score=66.55 TRINITY_DN11139_c0_g1_i1:39-1715(+)
MSKEHKKDQSSGSQSRRSPNNNRRVQMDVEGGRPPKRHHHHKLPGTLRSALTHVVGVEPHNHHHHSHHDIPDGYVVRFDRRTGRSYLIEKDKAHEWDQDQRRKKWKTETKLGLCSKKSLLGKTFGEGIYLYFDFIRYTTITNLILAILMMVNIVAHFYYDGFKVSTNPRETLRNFFTSSYGPETFYYWMGSMIAASFSTFLFGPALSLRIKWRFKRLFHHHDHEDKFEIADLDVIKDEAGNVLNPKERGNTCRKITSFTLFGCMVIISIFLGGILNMAQLTLDDSLIVTVGLSFFLLVSNWIWWKACDLLTKLEGHYTWTSYRKYLTTKFFIWKVLNLSTIFLSRFVVRIYTKEIIDNIPIWGAFASENKSYNSHTCSLYADQEQFLILIALDLTVERFINFVYPWLYYKVWSFCNRSKHPGPYSDRGRPDFDVADEYLNILYRQFLIYLGLTIFPWIAFIGMIGNLTEYPIDKWILLNVSRTPPLLRGSMRSFLVFFMFITALLGLAMFPQGIGWVLAGFSYRDSCPDTIFTMTWDLISNNTLTLPGNTTVSLAPVN